MADHLAHGDDIAAAVHSSLEDYAEGIKSPVRIDEDGEEEASKHAMADDEAAAAAAAEAEEYV
ncbi:hypothetical protein GGF46_002222, partial [Coemansia sp. RSA 552]